MFMPENQGPCPCGSGQRYRDCCRRLPGRFTPADIVLTHEFLDRQLLAVGGEDLLGELLQEFWGLDRQTYSAAQRAAMLVIGDEPWVARHFADWTRFDCPLVKHPPHDLTIAAATLRLAQEKAELTTWAPGALSYLQTVSVTPMSLYVYQRDVGGDVGELYDLLQARTYQVQGGAALDSRPSPGTLLVTRLVDPEPDTWMMLADPYEFPAHHQEILLQRVARAKKRARTKSAAAFLHTLTASWHQWWAELVGFAKYSRKTVAVTPPPDSIPLTTTDGQPLELATLKLTVHDRARFRTFLATTTVFHPLSPSRYEWSEAVPGGPRRLGVAELVDTEFRLHTYARAHAHRAQALLHQAGASVATIEGLEHQLNTTGVTSIPLEGLEASPGVDIGAVLQAGLTKSLEQRYRQWLTESIPLLDGLTPREAVGRPLYHDRLRALVTTLARPIPDLQDPTHLIPVDTEWIWAELGLSRTPTKQSV